MAVDKSLVSGSTTMLVLKLLEEKEKLWLFVKIQNTNKPKVNKEEIWHVLKILNYLAKSKFGLA